MAEKHETKPHTCKPCSILCGHKGRFGGKELAVPEYETVGLLGSNLGIFDAARIAELNDLCTRLGVDTISAGGTIAWVMEAAEKGLVESPLRFGSADGVAEAIGDIAHRRGFGVEMGRGSRWLGQTYGGLDFAIQVKGLEIAAYDPRGAVGQGLNYAVANRGGCHLSGYVVGLERTFGLLDPDTTRAKAQFVRFLEGVSNGVNSLQTCLFSAFAYLFEPPLTKYTPHPVLSFLMQNLPGLAIRLTDVSVLSGLWSGVTGEKLTGREFLEAGHRINTLERYMNTREGISRKDDTLPHRMLHEPRSCDPKGRTVDLEPMLAKYYKISGYDYQGVPTQKTLGKMGISIRTDD